MFVDIQMTAVNYILGDCGSRIPILVMKQNVVII